jgi:hypothetical protein
VAETFEGDSVQSPRIRDDESVTAEPYFDRQADGPVVEVSVYQGVGNQLPLNVRRGQASRSWTVPSPAGHCPNSPSARHTYSRPLVRRVTLRRFAVGVVDPLCGKVKLGTELKLCGKVKWSGRPLLVTSAIRFSTAASPAWASDYGLRTTDYGRRRKCTTPF